MASPFSLHPNSVGGDACLSADRSGDVSAIAPSALVIRTPAECIRQIRQIANLRYEVEWDWGARSRGPCFPSPLHSFRTVGFPQYGWKCGLLPVALPPDDVWQPFSVVPITRICPGVPSLFRGNHLTAVTVPLPTTPTGPWLSAVYHPRTCKRYYGLMRQSDGLRPVYGLSRSVFALAGRPPHLPFFALTHVLRPCRYPYPADGPSSFDGSSLGHTSLHPLLSGSAVSVCPLTGFREVRLTRQQFSRHVAACTLARAAVQSPPTPSRRQAHPFTAELAPARVSSSQSLLSLLGPTTYCRGGIFTRSRIKERRLHQKPTKETDGENNVRRVQLWLPSFASLTIQALILASSRVTRIWDGR